MTEIERIIEKGIISEDFLKEEVKNDFLVTTERKKLWAVILDLLLEFDRVCKKIGWRYFLDGGSLIGAIRHNGFIPWDDDLDFCMPRDDYERFVLSGIDFDYPFFLQTPYSDPEYFYGFAKIRNSNTTGIVEMFKYQQFNHGIWISVFPLDYWDKDAENEYEIIKALNIENSTYMRMSNPFLDERNKERVKMYSGRNPMETYEEIQRRARQFNSIGSIYMTAAVSSVLSYQKKLWFSDDFSSAVLADFEGYKVPVPIGYDRILKTVFGDYMQLPPIEERGLHHSGTFFDADKPYTKYINN